MRALLLAAPARRASPDAAGTATRRRSPAARRCAARSSTPTATARWSAGRGSRCATAAAAAGPGAVLATVVQLTDLHVRDEESPGRAPFLDRLGAPFGSTFRPQEALSTQVLAAAVRAANAARPDAAFVTGDLLDSASAGRARPGARRAGRRRGRSGHRPPGLRGRPGGGRGRPALLPARRSTRRAIRACSRAAARPFRSPGLRAPWYPALGNHDLLVQGETPPTAQLDAFATGTRMVTGLDPGLRADPSADSARGGPRAAGRGRAGPRPHRRRRPGAPLPAPARADRGARPRARRRAPALRAAAGRATLDYAVDLGPDARALVLDTVDRAGGSRGLLRPEQLDWLRAELARAGDRARARLQPQPARQHRGRRARRWPRWRRRPPPSSR